MSAYGAGLLPSVRRQHLLSEFAGLKQACPEGVFVSLTPGDPTLWSAVLFIRQGPYAPAILRFHVSFPDAYPALPPLVTFSTDMFHPLITPLTTYTYTTDIQDNGTVSATDEERLPPGGFSLRHGFPEWFGRGRRSAAGSRQVSGGQPGPGGFSTPKAKSVGEPLLLSSAQQSPESVYSASAGRGGGRGASAYDVLKYIRSAFTDENILDSLTLGEAGNPGAWHAWRTHRRKLIRLKETDGDGDGEGDAVASDSGKALASQSGARKPGEWNWDGVWEDRVKKSIAASLSEPVLYGASSHPDELIHFLAMEENEVASVKENIRRTLESTG